MVELGMIGRPTEQASAWPPGHALGRLDAALRRPRPGPLQVQALDMAQLSRWRAAGRRDEIRAALVHAGCRLRALGAQRLAIACAALNDMADAVAQETRLPVLHVADAAGRAARAAGAARIALLGSLRHTVDAVPVVQAQLRQRHGLDVCLPDDVDAATLHLVIHEELARGWAAESSRRAVEDIAARLHVRGAQAFLLLEPRLHVLTGQRLWGLPVLDLHELHARELLRGCSRSGNGGISELASVPMTSEPTCTDADDTGCHRSG